MFLKNFFATQCLFVSSLLYAISPTMQPEQLTAPTIITTLSYINFDENYDLLCKYIASLHNASAREKSELQHLLRQRQKILISYRDSFAHNNIGTLAKIGLVASPFILHAQQHFSSAAAIGTLTFASASFLTFIVHSALSVLDYTDIEGDLQIMRIDTLLSLLNEHASHELLNNTLTP